jgi:hypothetical protein
MPDTTSSVFHQLGQAVKAEIATGNSTVLNVANTFTAVQTFNDVNIDGTLRVDSENLGDLDDFEAGLNS